MDCALCTVVHLLMHQWLKRLSVYLAYLVNVFRPRELSINGKTQRFSMINSLERLVINTNINLLTLENTKKGKGRENYQPQNIFRCRVGMKERGLSKLIKRIC